MTKQDRIVKVNQMIKVIGDCGRRFFYSKDHDRYAAIEMDSRGKIWWIDDYTGKRIYTHYIYNWKGFSHGGTLRNLVEHFRNYVSKGKPINLNFFGPWPDYYCNGDLWGYGKDIMKKVRDEAGRLFGDPSIDHF